MIQERPPRLGGSRSALARFHWRYRNAWAASCCLGLLPALGATASAEPPPLVVDADARHEMQARQALYQDRLLAPLNLGVRVHNHVAVLWGPVPSAELGRRAVAMLQRLPELVEVRTELHVQPPEDPPPAIRYLPPQIPPMGPLPLPRVSQVPAPSPGVLTQHSALSPQGAPSPVGYPQWKPGEAGKAVVVARGEGDAEAVLPAISLPQQADSALAATDRGEWLIEAVTRLQRGDPRYRQLRPEVHGKTVHLNGAVDQWSDLYDLARRLARLPGVERVVVGDIRTGGASR